MTLAKNTLALAVFIDTFASRQMSKTKIIEGGHTNEQGLMIITL